MRRSFSVAFALFVCVLAIAWTTLAVAAPPSFPEWAHPITDKPFVGVVTTQSVVAVTVDDIRSGWLGRAMADAFVDNGLPVSFFCVSSQLATEDAQYDALRGVERSVTPPAGRKIQVQVRKFRANGTTISVKSTSMKPTASGHWSLRLGLARGTYRVRGTVSSGSMYGSGVSRWFKFRVR